MVVRVKVKVSVLSNGRGRRSSYGYYSSDRGPAELSSMVEVRKTEQSWEQTGR